MLLYIIECANSEQADEITTDLFKENLVFMVYCLEGVKINSLNMGNDKINVRGTLLLALSKALLFNEIEKKVNSFPDTFLIGVPVSAVDWDKITPLLEKTKKV